MVKIKVCGLREAENIREIAETSPGFMGFIFHPASARYIGKNAGKELFNHVPPGIFKTGVFVDEEIVTVKETVNRFGLDAVQFHGSESPGYCSYFKTRGLITIKTFGISTGFDFSLTSSYLSSCDYFLFDTKSEASGGSGKKFRWDLLEKYRLDKPFFLSGGIGYEDIPELRNLSYKELFGVDINSRFELSPGIKNVALVRSFINEINNTVI